MFRKILRKMVENGNHTKKDLGIVDAIQSEDRLTQACQEMAQSQVAFEQSIDKLTRMVRRHTDRTRRKTEVMPQNQRRAET